MTPSSSISVRVMGTRVDPGWREEGGGRGRRGEGERGEGEGGEEERERGERKRANRGSKGI